MHIRLLSTFPNHLHTYTLASKLHESNTINDQQLVKYSYFSPSALSLRQLLKIDDITSSYKFLCSEIPTRMAQVIKEIEYLPQSEWKNMNDHSRIQLIEKYKHQMYFLLKFDNYPECNPDILSAYYKLLKDITSDTTDMEIALNMIGQEAPKASFFLDRFIINRLSYRMLMNRHCDTYEQLVNNISADCEFNINSLLFTVFQNIHRNDLRLQFLQPKELHVTHVKSFLEDLFTQVLSFICHTAKKDSVITCVITSLHDSIIIEISNYGQGFSLREQDEIWNYNEPAESKSSLPTCRAHVQYLQGDLKLSSIQGNGSKVTLHIPLHLDKTFEKIPIYNIGTVKYYDNKTLRDMYRNHQLGMLHNYEYQI